MAANKNNQKLSQIREILPITDFPMQYGFKDPGLIEPESLVMCFQIFSGGAGGRKVRAMSTRLTYDAIYRTIFRHLLKNVGKDNYYTMSGKFNFATHAKNLYCSNAPAEGTPGGRQVLNYKQCKKWFSVNGFADTLREAGYNDDHTNDNYDPNPNS